MNEENNAAFHRTFNFLSSLTATSVLALKLFQLPICLRMILSGNSIKYIYSVGLIVSFYDLFLRVLSLKPEFVSWSFPCLQNFRQEK